MPLVALDRKTGARLDMTRIANPRQELGGADLACPLCDVDMIVVAGLLRINHFRHRVACTSDYGQHPESPEHLRAKEELVRILRDYGEEYSTATIELEVAIPEVKRVADILITFPMGWRIAHEIQLSPITIGEIEKRSEDYREAGIDVIWWLGPKNRSEQLRQWAMGYSDGVYMVDFRGTDETDLHDLEELARTQVSG